MKGLALQTILAQASAGSAGRDPTKLLIVIGLLIVMVLIFGLAVLQLRRKILAKDDSPSAPASILDELRSMRKRGEITEEEYQAARRKMIDKMSPRSAGGLSAGTDHGERPMNIAPPPPHRSANVRSRPGFDLTGDPLPEMKDPPGTDDAKEQNDQSSRPR